MSINPWLSPSRSRKIILRALILSSGSTPRKVLGSTSRKIYNRIYPGSKTPESAAAPDYHLFLRDWEEAQRFPMSQQQVNYHLRQLKKEGFVDFLYRPVYLKGVGRYYRYPLYKLSRKGVRYSLIHHLF